jgi:hypothetical protein
VFRYWVVIFCRVKSVAIAFSREELTFPAPLITALYRAVSSAVDTVPPVPLGSYQSKCRITSPVGNVPKKT